MAKFDRNALIDSVDAYTVALHIGMDVVRRGSRYCIQCPGHEKRLGKPDNQIGNAVLTNKGYHCYACECQVGIIDMVMEYCKCDVRKAMEIVGDACGGAKLYKTNNTDGNIKYPTINREDLALIGLMGSNNGASAKRLVNASKRMIEADDGLTCIKRDDEYYIYERIEGWSLSRLYRENEHKYNRIIAYAASNAMNKYEKAMKAVGSRDAEKAIVVYNMFQEDGAVDSTVFIGLKNAYQKKYWRAKEIYEEYIKKTTY